MFAWTMKSDSSISFTRIVASRVRPCQGTTGDLYFSVGHKSNGDVATWFNQQALADYNSCGHGAASLNFAFRSVLTLGLDSFGAIVVHNLLITQRHDATNNWSQMS
jgi:hypothetical protein